MAKPITSKASQMMEPQILGRIEQQAKGEVEK